MKNVGNNYFNLLVYNDLRMGCDGCEWSIGCYCSEFWVVILFSEKILGNDFRNYFFSKFLFIPKLFLKYIFGKHFLEFKFDFRKIFFRYVFGKSFSKINFIF